MRKVYHAEKSFSGVALAVIMGVGIAGTLFAIIPFSHMIAKPRSVVQLTSAKTVDLPPPVEAEATPPPSEPEKKEEAPPELKLADEPQKMKFSTDIETVGGSGGAFSGLGEVTKIAASSEVATDVVDMSELEKKPEAVSQVAPAYPSDLRKAKVEGVVTLLCLVSAQGRVEEVQVENSSRTEFEKPALDAIRKWRFRPGQKDGKEVATYLRCPIAFRIAK
jgi:protein TonB